MTDINQLITLGIGTPASIEHFILVGLNATGPVAVVDPDPVLIHVSARGRFILVGDRGRFVDVDAIGRVIDLGDKT